MKLCGTCRVLNYLVYLFILNFVSGTDMSRNQHLIIKNIFIFQSGKLSGDNYFEYYAGQIKRNH